MERVIVADANIVIAAANPAHLHHAAAQEIIRVHGSDGMALHSLTFAEVLVGPARAGALATARDALTAAGFHLSPAGDPPSEALALLRASTSLKMPDVCVLATAEHLRANLATFDARLAREAIAREIPVHGLDG